MRVCVCAAPKGLYLLGLLYFQLNQLGMSYLRVISIAFHSGFVYQRVKYLRIQIVCMLNSYMCNTWINMLFNMKLFNFNACNCGFTHSTDFPIYTISRYIEYFFGPICWIPRIYGEFQWNCWNKVVIVIIVVVVTYSVWSMSQRYC